MITIEKFNNLKVNQKLKVIRKILISSENQIINTNSLDINQVKLLESLIYAFGNPDLVKESGKLNLNSIKDLRYMAGIVEREMNLNLRDHDFLVNQPDGIRNAEKLDVEIVIHNLRSTFNIGSIIRTSECFGFSRIVFAGYSATPENPKVHKTAMGSSEYIDWIYTDDVEKYLSQRRTESKTIYALETCEGAVEISEAGIVQPAVIILGNEANGIDKKILTYADKVINIDLKGWKNSLNVGVAFGICAHEIIRQSRERK